MIESARFYSSLGWRVFPLKPGSKEPLIKNWESEATTDTVTIERWWGQWPAANIGLATGPSCLHVIDIDTGEGKPGFESLAELERDYGQIPRAVYQRTGGGGMQLVFSSDHNFRSYKLADGIDTRGAGGYVVLPPSIHPSGRPYEWLLDPTEGRQPPRLPAWIVSRFQERLAADNAPPAPPARVALTGPFATADIELKGFLSPTMLDLIRADGASHTDRSNADYSACCALVRRGLSDSEIEGVFQSYPIGMGKYSTRGTPYLMRTIAAARKKVLPGDITPYVYRNGSSSSPARNGSAPAAVPAGDQADGGRPTVRDYKNPQTAEIKTVLSWMGYEFRLNTLDDTIEVNANPITDGIEALIKNRLRDFGIRGMTHALDTVTQTAYQNRYNPIHEWLNGLKWDGRDHIRRLFDYVNESTGFGATALRRWLVGAVAKALDGEQNFMLVIDGPQGKGKSFFCSWLCPLPGYFIESGISPDNKDHRLRLITHLVWEVAELQATTRRADREALKQFITLQTVKERKSYGRYDIIKPAVSSFIGTINEDGSGFLYDTTGNRRFVIIKIESFDWRYADEINPADLWAQAVALYQAGEPWQLTADERHDQERIQSEYEVSSVVAAYFWDHYEVEPGDHYELQTDILTTLNNQGVRANDSVLRELTRLIRRAGGERIRPRVIDGKGKLTRPWAYRGVRPITPKQEDIPV